MSVRRKESLVRADVGVITDKHAIGPSEDQYGIGGRDAFCSTRIAHMPQVKLRKGRRFAPTFLWQG